MYQGGGGVFGVVTPPHMEFMYFAVNVILNVYKMFLMKLKNSMLK